MSGNPMLSTSDRQLWGNRSCGSTPMCLFSKFLLKLRNQSRFGCRFSGDDAVKMQVDLSVHDPS
jgi:hypothetical protein